MRNDPDHEYWFLVASSMLLGTAIAWLSLLGSYLSIELWAPNPSVTLSAWLAGTAIIVSGLVELLGMFYMVLPLNGRERVGLAIIMFIASVPIWLVFFGE